jgi:hypothetical protein
MVIELFQDETARAARLSVHDSREQHLGGCFISKQLDHHRVTVPR